MKNSKWMALLNYEKNVLLHDNTLWQALAYYFLSILLLQFISKYNDAPSFAMLVLIAYFALIYWRERKAQHDLDLISLVVLSGVKIEYIIIQIVCNLYYSAILSGSAILLTNIFYDFSSYAAFVMWPALFSISNIIFMLSLLHNYQIGLLNCLLVMPLATPIMLIVSISWQEPEYYLLNWALACLESAIIMPASFYLLSPKTR